MNKKSLIGLVLFILLGLISYFLYVNVLYKYMIITIPLAFVSLFFFIKGLNFNKSPEDEYNSFLKKIMNTYDAVLVDVVDLPSIGDRSIVEVSNFDDLIDAQIEVRKPIYYKREDRSVLFVLVDDTQACILLLKVDDSEETGFDNWLKEQRNKTKNNAESVFDGIENTTVVKLSNNKSYRISPLKDNSRGTIKDSKLLGQTLANLPKLKDMDDVSKTQVFKSLNRRAKKNKK